MCCERDSSRMYFFEVFIYIMRKTFDTGVAAWSRNATSVKVDAFDHPCHNVLQCLLNHRHTGHNKFLIGGQAIEHILNFKQPRQPVDQTGNSPGRSPASKVISDFLHSSVAASAG